MPKVFTSQECAGEGAALTHRCPQWTSEELVVPKCISCRQLCPERRGRTAGGPRGRGASAELSAGASDTSLQTVPIAFCWCCWGRRLILKTSGDEGRRLRGAWNG